MVIFLYVFLFFLILELISFFCYEKIISVSESHFESKIVSRNEYSKVYNESLNNPIELEFYEISFLENDIKVSVDVSFETYEKYRNKSTIKVKKITKCIEKKKLFIFNPNKAFCKYHFETYIVE